MRDVRVVAKVPSADPVSLVATLGYHGIRAREVCGGRVVVILPCAGVDEDTKRSLFMIPDELGPKTNDEIQFGLDCWEENGELDGVLFGRVICGTDGRPLMPLSVRTLGSCMRFCSPDSVVTTTVSVETKGSRESTFVEVVKHVIVELPKGNCVMLNKVVTFGGKLDEVVASAEHNCFLRAIAAAGAKARCRKCRIPHYAVPLQVFIPCGHTPLIHLLAKPIPIDARELLRKATT